MKLKKRWKNKRNLPQITVEIKKKGEDEEAAIAAGFVT